MLIFNQNLYYANYQYKTKILIKEQDQKHIRLHSSFAMVVRLTWISSSNNTSLREVTVEIMAPIGLVVGIHGISGKSLNVVGCKAISSWLNWPTINSLAAHIVYVCLQSLVASICLWHTPFLTSYCRCRFCRSCRSCRCRSCRCNCLHLFIQKCLNNNIT